MSDEGPTFRVVPGARLVPAAALALPLALGGLPGALGALAIDVALVGASWLEGRLLGGRAPSVERRLEGRLVVGSRCEVVVRLHNPGVRPLRVTLRDDLPPGLQSEPPEVTLDLPPHGRRDARYAFVPTTRGEVHFGDLHLRIEGGLGLGAAIVTIPAAATLKVYPNVLGPRRYEIAARLGRLRTQGFRAVRASGGGGEFEQLREYVHGDSFRDLDWKSTAKRQRPVTRVMQDERSQTVMLAIDAGRMMASVLTEDGDEHEARSVTKLDHAINAALLLAHVALRHGDRVGLLVFAGRVQQYVPAGRGAGQYRRLLEALYAIEAADEWVDFRRVLEFVNLRVRKRSLLVIFSDLLDESHAMPLAQHAALLRRVHLPVCVTMKDAVADALAVAPVSSQEEAYMRAAASDLLAERAAVQAHLKSAGVGLVEAPPGELAVAAVNRYLEVKARRAL